MFYFVVKLLQLHFCKQLFTGLYITYKFSINENSVLLDYSRKAALIKLNIRSIEPSDLYYYY